MTAIANQSNSNLRLPILAGMLLTTLLGLTGVKAAEKVPATNQQLQTGKQQAQQPEASAVPQPMKARHRWYQIGRASWYGTFFQGRSTASGETFDMNLMTCAHRSLPLGSLIRVTNLRNHKTVVVRVNDRGPVPDDRVVDLSFAAARILGFSTKGLAPVKLELIASTENDASPFDMSAALEQ